MAERIHVIYEKPLDMPEHFVVRGWTGDEPERGCMAFTTLRAARAYCKALGLVAFNKDPESDPVIKEIWAPIGTGWPFGMRQGCLDLEVEGGAAVGKDAGA